MSRLSNGFSIVILVQGTIRVLEQESVINWACFRKNASILEFYKLLISCKAFYIKKAIF